MNISNMHDLRIAKMECRHKIEVQERAYAELPVRFENCCTRKSENIT